MTEASQPHQPLCAHRSGLITDRGMGGAEGAARDRMAAKTEIDRSGRPVGPAALTSSHGQDGGLRPFRRRRR